MTHNSTLDTDAAYKVEGYGGVAWRFIGHPEECQEEWFFIGSDTDDKDDDDNYAHEVYWYPNEQMVNMVMIGDDRTFTFDREAIVKIPDDAYCALCGQIGCTHDGRERD